LSGGGPEIRRDAVTGVRSIMAPSRSKRPHTTRDDAEQLCPFCPGNEAMTPPEVWALGRKGSLADTPGWEVRVIPNLYPALEPDLPEKGWRRGNRIGRPARGYHEVIINSPVHDLTLARMDLARALKLMLAWRSRYSELASFPQVAQVLIIVNHGPEAGASIEHPHTQVIALPLVPELTLDELRNTSNAWPRKCLLCEDVVEARDDGRVTAENASWTAFTPYASRLPYEVRLVPISHKPALDGASDAELEALAQILPSSLAALSRVLDDPPYNLFIHCAPCDGKDYQHYHWHLEIIPRHEKSAGFEIGSGMYITTCDPNEAAEKLREAMRK
jgi:UDPglucose--hexose-1-phosphate uridylyltransferase